MVHLPNNKKKWMSVISLRLERILGWFSMASFTVAHALIPHQIDNIDAQQNFSIYLLLYSVYLLVVYFFLLSFRPWFVHTSGGLVVYALAHLYMRFRSYTLYVSFSHSYHSWWIFFFFSSFALSPLLSLSLSSAIFLTLSLCCGLSCIHIREYCMLLRLVLCVCVWLSTTCDGVRIFAQNNIRPKMTFVRCAARKRWRYKCRATNNGEFGYCAEFGLSYDRG